MEDRTGLQRTAREADKPEGNILMHTSSVLTQEQKFQALVPAACLLLLTLVSLSASGRPEHFPLTLTAFVTVISILVMALIRAGP